MIREDRPWGSFEILYEDSQIKVKRIVVKPGQRLSLQSHAKRSENWLVLSGRAIVTVDAGKAHLFANQAIFIPCGAKHRVENPGEEELVFVEVQTGSYFGEDDIIRYQDDYQRS
jgi:mannose-1-phosphate guanylyltransferase/mannose-6-phosphate isomerase